MKRVNVKQTILFSALGVIPVVWLALVTAPAVSGVGSIAGKLPGVLQSLTAALNNPLKIRFCEGSLKTALFFIAAYGMGIGIYLSTRRNTRPREEHGSARWGDAAAVNRKIADRLFSENRLLTKNVRLGLDSRKHGLNLNVLCVGGYATVPAAILQRRPQTRRYAAGAGTLSHG